MPQNLRSILGTSGRVKKTPRTQGSRSGTSSPSPRKATSSPRKPRRQRGEDATELAFEDRLDDAGTAKLLEEAELTLRDVVQAMRYIRGHMFSPVPERGIHSTRTAELRTYRASMPPLVTAGHLHAVLDAPTRVERETADLMARGAVRRVRVGRRGAMGEALIEAPDLVAMVRDAGLPAASADRFITFLRENPTAQTLPRDALSDAQADELVRAGFLTSSLRTGPGSTLDVRPEDRTTLTSIQRISRHASGSLSAVGGPGAIHLSGGGSGAPSLTEPSWAPGAADLRVAVPGHGRHLKLSSAGIEWLREALSRTRWGECPEAWLKERFEGGGLYGPRWKEFWGVRWEWVLGEAVGLGVVEVFETRSVGRGVRALG